MLYHEQIDHDLSLNSVFICQKIDKKTHIDLFFREFTVIYSAYIACASQVSGSGQWQHDVPCWQRGRPLLRVPGRCLDLLATGIVY